MYLLYSSECEYHADFFLYGGIAFEAEKAKSLSDQIGELLTKNGVGHDDLFGFDDRPSSVEESTHEGLNLKTAVGLVL